MSELLGDGLMNDKLVAGFVTGAAITPICAVCVLGPSAVGSSLAWITGWFSGFSPVTTTGMAIIAAILVYGFAKRRRARVAAGCDQRADVTEDGAARFRVNQSGQPDLARDGRHKAVELDPSGRLVMSSISLESRDGP